MAQLQKLEGKLLASEREVLPLLKSPVSEQDVTDGFGLFDMSGNV